MSDFAMISQALPQVFTLYNMMLIFGGLILGMVIGCVPGLSVTLGIILMLPLTYTFSDPASAIILLLAVYVGGMYGGSISAITLNTPGTNSAIATTFDGYPLAKQGKVKKALDTSLFASVFGGLFSAVLLLICASLITKLVANFTSVEYFSLGIMGISLIAGVSGSSLPKSLISGMIGLLMACVGMDAVTGVTRFSFGSATLKYGIDMLPAMIALIALTQVVQKLRDQERADQHPARLLPFLRHRQHSGRHARCRRRRGPVPVLQRGPPYLQAPRGVRQGLPGRHCCGRILQQRRGRLRHDPPADAGHPR